MKTIIILIAVSLYTASLSSQVTQQWEQNYNDIFNYNDVGSYVFVDGSGNVYVTGTSYDYSGNNNDIFTIKYGPQGGQLWKTEYGNLFVNTIDMPSGMTVDNSGNVYVCGDHWVSNGVTHFLTIKYNSSGDQLWAVQYAGPISGLASANSIAVDGSGNVYVTGPCIGYFFNYDWATIKYNANGVQQWAQVYNAPASGDDSPSRMILDNSGNVYVTGYESINSSHIEYCTIKYSPSGNQQWKSVYSGPGGYDAPNSITIDGSGNTYVTGSSKGTDSYNHCATVKINSSGVQQWVQRYNGGGNGDDEGIKTIFKNGNVYVCGFSQGVGTGRDYLTIKYSSSGNELWTKTYDGPISGWDQGNSIAVDDYDDVYVTGESKGVDGITHVTTVRYNPNGSTQWVERYNSGQCSGYVDEGGVDIAIGPTGGVLVTGWVTHIDNNCSFPDCCTIKYTQSNLGITTISGNIPDKYSLEQNYPNPFNPTTNINFSLPKTGYVNLVVYDITGKVVETLINKNLSAGIYKTDFDASKLASGVYLYKITTEEFTETKKMLLVK